MWIYLIASGMGFLVLVQTFRLGDRDITVRCLRTGQDNLLRQRESYYEKLQDMTVSRDGYAAMYQDACDEITALHQQVSRLQEEALVFDKAESDYTDAINQKNEVIKKQRYLIRDLERNRAMEPAGHLRKSMTEMFRFVAVNQWLLESDPVFAEAVASVGEVAASITERED